MQNDELNHDNGNNTYNGLEERTVHWMSSENILKSKEAQAYDYYSGSWLLPVTLLEPLNASEFKVLEDAAHRVFKIHNERVRMSIDWLDFSVEHLSRLHKSLDLLQANHNDVGINKITGNLMKYIQDTPERTKALVSASKSNIPLLHPTIAVISSSTIFDGTSPVSVSRSAILTATTIGATIASLMRIGIGRIVCTVIDEADEISVSQTYALVMEQYANRTDYISSTELSIVRVGKELYTSQFAKVNRPKSTLYGLQQALEGKFNDTYTEKWLGTLYEPSYWKYVYFSEPDLVLQTRAASLPAIHKELEQGHVLMPHRFQAIKHEADFIKDNIVYNGSNFVPNEGKYTNILDLDGDEDMCCDGGMDRLTRWDLKGDPLSKDPGRRKHKWWSCGYRKRYANISNEVKHRRLLFYAPFIRLTQGIDIVTISGTEHKRRCYPTKRQAPNEICEPPKPSGRSFATSDNKSRS